LGLGGRLVSRETLEGLAGARIGAAASRLVQGTFEEHVELEQELAAWTGFPASLLTLSAFAANVGLIPALAGPDALVVSDALNHASIVDGCRLAKARVVITPHLALEAVEAALAGHHGGGPAWVVTEGLFSMDGDCPDLHALRVLCDRYEAGLVVDEAHSLGVLGPEGAGRAAAQAVRPDVLVAGLGKAVGAQGGVVASSEAMRTWLWNRARGFVFSTAPSPALTRLVLEQARLARAANAARSTLARRSRELRSGLEEIGVPALGLAESPIVPIVLGPSARALEVMQTLRTRGILVQAIRPPTVPPGAARLRLTVHADWPDDAVPRIIEALELACASS
jgi:8-amino-7-oxononanoate synthase